MSKIQEITFDLPEANETEPDDCFNTDALGMFEGYGDMLNVDDLCAILHLAKKTVQRQCARGDLPAVKIGRHWYVAKLRLAKLMLEGE